MLKSSYTFDKIEAGCDEAGRGCLAGPVFAAAVILPKNFKNSVLTDSKLLSEEKRLQLRKIIENEALSWAVAQASQEEIDQINILNAGFLAMHRAIEKLPLVPELLLIDGKRFTRYKMLKNICLIKGDSQFLSIAAASVLAKTYRDEFMQTAHLQFPHYFWNKNKGYPTSQHRQAIFEHGLSIFHRKTFRSGFQTTIDFTPERLSERSHQ